MTRRAATRPVGGSDAGLAGALLLDLARLELVGTDAGGKIAALEASRPATSSCATCTPRSRSSKRRDAKAWVDAFRTTSRRCASESPAGSCSAASSPRSTRRCSGSYLTTRFPMVDPRPERDLRERLREVLFTDREPTERGGDAGRTPRAARADRLARAQGSARDARKRAKAVASKASPAPQCATRCARSRPPSSRRTSATAGSR